MFGTVVLGVRDEPFEQLLAEWRARRGVENDADLAAEDLRSHRRALPGHRPGAVRPRVPGRPAGAAAAGHRGGVPLAGTASARRTTATPRGSRDDLGTAVNIVAMVFGNMGEDSATGVATTRNVSTGENALEGDYLINAQGEDVVRGHPRHPAHRAAGRGDAGGVHRARGASRGCSSSTTARCRTSSSPSSAASSGCSRPATPSAPPRPRCGSRWTWPKEKLITREEAVLRVTPEHVDFFLHPQFDPESMRTARAERRLLASGLNVSPGAAVGQIAFDADTAERWAKEKKAAVIMVRPETKPDDVHGMLAARGHPHQPRRTDQPRGAGGAPVRQAGRGGGRWRWRSTPTDGSHASSAPRRCSARATGSPSTGRPARCSWARWRPCMPDSGGPVR